MGRAMSDQGISPNAPDPDEPLHLVNGEVEGPSSDELCNSESDEDAEESLTPAGYVLLPQNEEELEEGEGELGDHVRHKAVSLAESRGTSQTSAPMPSAPVVMEEGKMPICALGS